MLRVTMLEQENALPSPELHPSFNNRHSLACARQDHADVRWHVIAALRAVSKVISIFRYQAIEEFLEIMSRGWIGVLHDDHAATGVLNKHGSPCDWCGLRVGRGVRALGALLSNAAMRAILLAFWTVSNVASQTASPQSSPRLRKGRGGRT